MIRYKIKISKRGQITIPKALRQSLDLKPGSTVALDFGDEGKLSLSNIEEEASKASCRFESARGKADISCRTDDLMSILRD